MYTNFQKLQLINNRPKLNKALKVRYSLRFKSLIAPSGMAKLTVLQRNYQPSNTPRSKLSIKNSYIISSWMSYVRSYYSDNIDAGTSKTPSIFCYPSRTQTSTHLKAPMAHKTFSQEQFKSKFYFMSATFHINNDLHNFNKPDSLNKAIYLSLMSRKLSKDFTATNLFILSRLEFSFGSADNNFIDYYHFTDTI